MTLPASLPSIGAEGGAGSLTINVAAECVWSASSASDWITITSNSSGQGNGVVNFAAASNPAGSIRRGAVLVGERRVELTQAAAACHFNLSPATAAVGPDGEEGVITVTVVDGCQWSATSQAPWLSIVSGQSGVGGGSVRFRADANGGPSRSGSLTIADRTFAVNQSGVEPGCALTLDRTERSISASGGPDAVTVTAGNCSWVAESRAAWIVITNGAAGNGNGTVSLNIAPNSGGPRTGVVMVAGYMYLVTQAAAPTAPPTANCSYSINATHFSALSGGASASVTVTAQSGCAWTATSQTAWVTVTNGASGSGNGTVDLVVASNAGGQRSGVVTVAGHTYTVTQSAAEPSCSYGISSGDQTVTAVGGPASVGVTAGEGCSWTAASDVPWIVIVSGASGSGNGTVMLAVAANTGAQRVGHITIAGQTHTLTQVASPVSVPPPCSYSLDASDASVGAAGGTIQVAVTSGSGCDWTATSQVSWITVTSGAAGSGNGTVLLSVASNGGSQRAGNVTIAGETFTVTQEGAAACTYSISPTSQSVGPNGGNFNVSITTQAGCQWTAVSQDGWIQLTSNASGSGNGLVSYSVDAVLLFSRSGRITVAGGTLTVNQAAVLLDSDR